MQSKHLCKTYIYVKHIYQKTSAHMVYTLAVYDSFSNLNHTKIRKFNFKWDITHLHALKVKTV